MEFWAILGALAFLVTLKIAFYLAFRRAMKPRDRTPSAIRKGEAAP